MAQEKERTDLTATTEETRAVLDKYQGEKTEPLSKQFTMPSVREAAPSGGVKAQFYPEIEPRMRSMTLSDVEAADERFGRREEESEALFSTAVDEDVINQAKERQRRALGGVRLGNDPGKSPFINGSDVITTRAMDHYQAGVELMQNNDHINAIIKFNKAVHLRDDVIDFYVQRAECFIYVCDFQSAILNLKKACCLDPENGELFHHLAFVYFFQGQCLFDRRLYEEALQAFTKASEMSPEERGYQTRIIACLAALQRHGECLSLINRRLDVDRDNPDLLVMRARLHELFRHVTLCAYDVRDALFLNPDHREAQKLQKKMRKKSMENRQAAVQLSALGKSKEALQKISIAIEMDPGEAQYHVLRGALHRRLGDFNSAIDDYLIALDKSEHLDTSQTYQDAQRQLLLTYNDFAVECFDKGFYEEAVILLNKAVKGEKNEKGLYINRGDCFFKQGDLPFALADYEQALEMDPADQDVKTRLSVVQHEFGVLDYQDKKYEEAEKRFTAAIAENPHVGRYYISRSRTKYMLEEHEAARFDILTALLLDPSNEELISITSRLFPGQSVRDVLASPQAHEARKLIEGNASRATQRSAVTADKKPAASAEVPAPRVRRASPLWKREPLFPALSRCVNEWQFNLTIVEEKKTINHSIKHALHERKSLKYTGGRVTSMPSGDELRRHTKRTVKLQ